MTDDKPKLSEFNRTVFEKIVEAVKQERLALVAATNKETGEKAAVVGIAATLGDTLQFVPVAVLLSGVEQAKKYDVYFGEDYDVTTEDLLSPNTLIRRLEFLGEVAALAREFASNPTPEKYDALTAMHQKAVEDGLMTQEQADELTQELEQLKSTADRSEKVAVHFQADSEQQITVEFDLEMHNCDTCDAKPNCSPLLQAAILELKKDPHSTAAKHAVGALVKETFGEDAFVPTKH